MVIVIMFNVCISQANENCQTALSRITKTAVEQAISENQKTACKGLKSGPLGLDKTRELQLLTFKLCENGAEVTTEIAIRIKCATSENAVLKVTQEDTIYAQASANLDKCSVSESTIKASGFLLDGVLDITQANQRFMESIKKEIEPYCSISHN